MADDMNVYAKSKRADDRVMASVFEGCRYLGRSVAGSTGEACRDGGAAADEPVVGQQPGLRLKSLQAFLDTRRDRVAQGSLIAFIKSAASITAKVAASERLASSPDMIGASSPRMTRAKWATCSV